MAEDFLGNEYAPGDIVVYAAMSGRSVTMVKAEVLELKENGNVKLQPLMSSRWKQHHVREHFEDSRTGKRIDPYASSGKHIEEQGHYIHLPSGEKTEDRFQHARNQHPGRAPVGYLDSFNDYEWVPTKFKDYVTKVTDDKVKPVTLTVTENIVLLEKKHG